MSYQVKEIFYSLQGEGAQTGRAAVFCRFSGCNLWTGREEDRKWARCHFCDTDFLGMNGEHGGMFQSTDRLVEEMRLLWAENTGETSVTPFVILTGGEPGLQVDAPLIHRLHQTGFEVAIETNGTLDLPLGIDWICVSPKSGTQLRMQRGNEIKIVFPQENLDPRDFECLAFDYFFLQPRHAPEYEENLRQTIAYCIMNPRWRLSLQTHKLIGIR